jgi:hypothetical protein
LSQSFRLPFCTTRRLRVHTFTRFLCWKS